ncbi:response regulator [Calidifontibacter terrae]
MSDNDQSTDPIRVLVVDDDFRVADVHASMVAAIPGFEAVGRAHTAADARALARDLRPDLALMDIYLPDGNGLDVVRELIAGPERIDVMVISAAQDVESVRTAMQLGAIHYLLKPFAFDQLVARLTAYGRVRRRMSDLPTTADQADVDELFRLRQIDEAEQPRLPKGHSSPTLELVRNAVRSATPDVSAGDVAEIVGISRATAQRYLIYLQEQGVVSLRLKYGAAGRPEHRYYV